MANDLDSHLSSRIQSCVTASVLFLNVRFGLFKAEGKILWDFFFVFCKKGKCLKCNSGNVTKEAEVSIICFMYYVCVMYVCIQSYFVFRMCTRMCMLMCFLVTLYPSCCELLTARI